MWNGFFFCFVCFFVLVCVFFDLTKLCENDDPLQSIDDYLLSHLFYKNQKITVCVG